jgi:antitoxin ParD1/3/4
MDTDTLPPDLARFADEAVAAGRFRDVADVIRTGVAMLQRSEAARAHLLASVVAAEAEGDRDGYFSLDQIEAEMRAAIRSAAHPDA